MPKDYMGKGNDKYMGKMKGKEGRLKDGAHASAPMYCDPFAAQKKMNKGLNPLPKDMRGYPEQAFKYNY